ncbi:hypothetical protein L2E82_19221 [Cichorium intybus]|uniref:Uncharacterized protein n=1 Tax=Cichorium intybus TaxID=13427 RepID=A0ACB9FCD3_CICIN|nr:hypothetical protein L2E82_19221 [Cichorium intybus]
MPRTTTVESAGSPPLHALTFDVLDSDSMHPSDSLIHTQSQSPDFEIVSCSGSSSQEDDYRLLEFENPCVPCR